MAITITGGLAFSGGVTMSSKVDTGSIVFNGSTQYLTLSTAQILAGTAPVTKWTTSGYTIEYWIKPTSFNMGVNNEPLVFGQNDPNSGSSNWTFGPMNDGKVQFYYYNNSINRLGTSTAISLNQWTHLAFVNNGGTLKIYINGVSSATGSVNGTPYVNGIGLSFGGAGGFRFNGSLTNLRVTNSAVYTANFTPPTSPLSAIANTSLLLLASTSGTLITDSSTNNYNLINNGGATWSSSSPFA